MAAAARKRKAEVLLTHAVFQFRQGRLGDSLALHWRALLLSAPWFLPLYRLVFRELLFLIRRRGKPDDLLGTLLKKEPPSTGST